MLKWIPKTIWKFIRHPSKKYCGKTVESIQTIPRCFKLWIPCWSNLHRYLPRGTHCFRPVFRQLLGGTTFNRLWHPMGHPWSDFVDLLEDVGSNFAPNVKDSRAAIRHFVNESYQAHLQKRNWIPTSIPIINPSKSFVTFVV